MPQNEHIELSVKRKGVRWDKEEKERKKGARTAKKISKKSQTLKGIKAKFFNKKRRVEKINIKKTIKAHEQKTIKTREKEIDTSTALPAYLLDRDNTNKSKVLSNMIKQKRKEKAGKWSVPIPKVRAIGEDEVFKSIQSGKRKRKSWKRMVTKVTFVGDAFTRKPPKYERFIRPMALRFSKAHVTHPELKSTFYLPIISVKKNPKSPMYTSLGVITKGTIIEVLKVLFNFR
uniref:Ribosome biogenesis protein NSA2 homolog (Trinotate prediction) n=1 Tax=Henneguya salminicola TaxID=69463 RepID=A0A6G3MF24_HENSL